MIELKPCPLCGSDDVKIDDCTNNYYGFMDYRIKCKCGIVFNSPPTGYGEITPTSIRTVRNNATKAKAKADMIEAWNRRTGR